MVEYALARLVVVEQGFPVLMIFLVFFVVVECKKTLEIAVAHPAVAIPHLYAVALALAHLAMVDPVAHPAVAILYAVAIALAHLAIVDPVVRMLAALFLAVVAPAYFEMAVGRAVVVLFVPDQSNREVD